MRLSIYLLLVTSLSLSAKGFSQTDIVSVEMRDAKMSSIIKEIRKVSDYRFLFRVEEVNKYGKRDFKVEKAHMEKVMTELLKGTDLSYSVENGIIIIKSKKVIDQEPDKKKSYVITGTVTDDNGVDMPGVNVVIQGTITGAVTDINGYYSIRVKKGDALHFSFIGYKEEIVLIKDQKKLDVSLDKEVSEIEEVVVVATGEQIRRESSVSSVSSVRTDLLKSGNNDLTSNLAGNVSGIFGWQQSGIPSALTEDEMNTKFSIRGISSFQKNANVRPLVLLDGVESSIVDLARIDPDDIASLTVMKDASATAMYGARGANGVIYVTTKTGKDGSMRTSFKAEGVFSTPTDEIDIANGVDYMKFYNEALLTRDKNTVPKYSAERIRRTASGMYPDWVYPNVNWIDKLFEKGTYNQHYGLSVNGGSKKLKYYASVNYNKDNGNLKTDRLNQFDANIQNSGITLRVNLNIKLNKTAKMYFNMFSTYDKNHTPLVGPNTIYAMCLGASQVDAPPVYPADEFHDWPHIRFGIIERSKNPYMEVQKGYLDRRRFSTTDRIEYIQRLDKLTPGLELRMDASMSKVAYFASQLSTNPAVYKLDWYNDVTGEHQLIALNPGATRTLGIDPRENVVYSSTNMTYHAKLMHNKQWNENNQTSFAAVLEAREGTQSYPETVFETMPQRNMGLSFRSSYSHKNKYFAEFSFGYNGSERFSNENKMGFFPSFGFAWIVSKENFMMRNKHWLDHLKLRASYGKVGNDGVIKDPRFVYLEEVITTVSGLTLGRGYKNQYGTEVRNYANPYTKWEIAEQLNFGLESKMFKGLIDFTAEAYQEIRHNIYDKRINLPATMGLHQAPLANVGKVRKRGCEFQLKLQKAFSNDFYFIVNSTLSYNKAVLLETEEPSGIPEYQSRIGKEISQQYGLISEGLFRDWEEIANSPEQLGHTMPGDIKYRDINGDNVINNDDAVAIGYPEQPRLMYGFSGFLHYKDWEFSIGFQGLGNRSFWIDAVRTSPFKENRALLQAYADNHWTEANQNTNALFPRFSEKGVYYHNPQEFYDYEQNPYRTTHFMQNGKFLRCKNIQITKYFKSKLAKKLNVDKFKLYVRATNPFLISKFKMWDVELGGNGFNYPIQKSYSLGLNVSF